jgi:hypothetical protein
VGDRGSAVLAQGVDQLLLLGDQRIDLLDLDFEEPRDHMLLICGRHDHREGSEQVVVNLGLAGTHST